MSIEPPTPARLSYRTASTGLTRDLNRAAIFRMIGTDGPIARTHIARRLGLSPATVTAVTRELLDQGLIRVADRSQARRGRPALLLEIVGGAAYALGVKIAADHITTVLVDLDGEVVERADLPFDAVAADPVGRLAGLLRPLVDGERSRSLLGVGLGVPGVVGATGRVTAPMLRWEDLPATEELSQQLGIPVLADNDVNTLAVAEHLYGRGRPMSEFLTVTIGRGIGLGIIIGGAVYRGYRGGAGEFGHVTAVDGGELCSCGKRGCLETVAADPALVAAAREAGLLAAEDGIETLRELAAAGSKGALVIYRRAGHALGRALADLVNVFSPEFVLVSGEGILAWPYLADSVESSFRAGLFPPFADVVVEIDPWDDAKWARGAASLVLRPTFVPSRADKADAQSVRERLTTASGIKQAVA